METVTFTGCSNEQATWAGGIDPRGLLEKGKTYEVVKQEVFDCHTHVYIMVNGEATPFNSGCFDNGHVDEVLELPDKVELTVMDSDNVFMVRISAVPRISQTGIANIIPVGRDISREGRDRTIAIGKKFVECWNKQ